jgi:aspartyl-tRNA(Asn)/glutamyl-tRNA(Gln) amidotransferase subunit C
MEITKDVIEHVASLARLNLTVREKEKLTLEMANIVSYMDKLNELDTSNVVPTAHVMPIRNVFREDKVFKSYEREKILANAPSRENGCFKVPKVVE